MVCNADLSRVASEADGLRLQYGLHLLFIAIDQFKRKGFCHRFFLAQFFETIVAENETLDESGAVICTEPGTCQRCALQLHLLQ